MIWYVLKRFLFLSIEKYAFIDTVYNSESNLHEFNWYLIVVIFEKLEIVK
jgi:hypothetical protein